MSDLPTEAIYALVDEPTDGPLKVRSGWRRKRIYGSLGHAKAARTNFRRPELKIVKYVASEVVDESSN